MTAMYLVAGVTKQAFNQWMKRASDRQALESNITEIIAQVRVDHPGMGVRAIWELMKPQIGRDAFEYLALINGFGVARKRKYNKTTDSDCTIRFPNLIREIQLTAVNQVWVSDITYYRMNDRFYYLTFVMDLFSRKLIGYSSSKNLRTQDTILKALQYAIQLRKGLPRSQKIILHSDGGGQFQDKELLKLMDKNDLKSSMGKGAYENPHIERLHRTIKNQYIYRYAPNSFDKLKHLTAKACLMYNSKKHRSLKKMSPNEFELRVCGIQKNGSFKHLYKNHISDYYNIT